jgi:TolA-binding protein
VRARLGDRARVTLVGPAEIAGVSSVGATMELTLTRGVLVADYDHRRGGRLQIRAPDGVTEVIGTLFCVEVQGGSSRVSVAHGRVSVQPARGAARLLSDGQAWMTGAPAPGPVSAAVWRLLRDHEGEHEHGPSPSAALPAPPRSTPPHRPALRRTIAHVSSAPPPPGEAVLPDVATLPPGEAPPATPAPPVPRATPESLYEAAEAAMARRDWPAATRRLGEVIASGSQSSLEDVARYELAQLALRAGDRLLAERHLEEMLATAREPALREPARLLQCEIAAQAGDGVRASRCLRDFRASFPGSRHDVTVLGWLVRLSPAVCGERALVEEYLRRYPAGPVAPEARRRRAACPPGSP